MDTRRHKASDIFQNTNYLFGEKTSSFDRAFPNIEDIRVSVEEYEDFSKVRDRLLNKNNAGEYVDCSNRLCYSGGFHLGSLIRRMSENREVEKEVTEYCHGYNGSPKGRKNYGPCEHRFNIKIKIMYKAENG